MIWHKNLILTVDANADALIDSIRSESDPIQHDPKINGSGMDLIFFIRIRSGWVRVNPTRPD
jgi:hypothetical protein